MEDTYDIVVADPPWSYYGSKTKWGANAKFYETMTDDEIASSFMPIHKRSIVFVWATSAKLDSAIEVLSEWGCRYRGVAWVWVKTRDDGRPIGAQGVRPSITKPTTEFVLAGSPCSTGRPLPLNDESIPQVILEPRREHSRKPDIVYSYIERMYPGKRYLEMFARNLREGWDSHGDELDKFPSVK